ncbi:FeoA family protein [Leekyejoonella antrihumi]|uniref:Ferrous iron transport protein A n=1 Tax=Leekyejoonella antrihumi TaxID=1660198 RepID=A0A563E4F1_9MICO|nr:FeoA family protein [Leekyejoonella antrihumi]TWP37386.1 ferrous iron transport protein A [Leekyejoonella antrihumi]
MSIGTLRLHERHARVTPAARQPGAEGRLADLRKGMTAEIVDLDLALGDSTARRLFDLGFVPGARVSVLRKAPMGDPVILQVAGYEVALRKAQTQSVRVRRLS